MVTRTNVITTGIGLRLVRMAKRDTDGTIDIPTTGAWVPSAGVGYEGIQAEGALRLTLNVPDPRRVTARGDDRGYYTFQLPPEDLPTGELAVSKTHMDIIAMASDTNEFGSTPIRKIGLATNKMGEEPAMFIRGSRQAVDTQDGSASFGTQIWQTYLVLNALVAHRPISFEDGNVGEFVYPLSANDATVDEFGVLFTPGVHGFTKAPYIMAVTQGKFGLDAFVQASARTQFTLTHTTLRAATTPLVSVAGVMTFSGWSESNGVITFDSPPTDAAKIIVEYEYED